MSLKEGDIFLIKAIVIRDDDEDWRVNPVSEVQMDYWYTSGVVLEEKINRSISEGSAFPATPEMKRQEVQSKIDAASKKLEELEKEMEELVQEGNI